jgi:hypothetical protein
MHIALLSELQQMLPEQASVIVLGDGEFDSIELQSFLADAGWDYVCRTAKNSLIQLDGDWMRLVDMDAWPDGCLMSASANKPIVPCWPSFGGAKAMPDRFIWSRI